MIGLAGVNFAVMNRFARVRAERRIAAVFVSAVTGKAIDRKSWLLCLCVMC